MAVLVQALADEVLVGHGGQDGEPERGDLVQPPRDLERVQGVLVQVVPRVHDDPLLGDAQGDGPLHGAQQVLADLRDDVVVPGLRRHRPGAVDVRQRVGDHEVGLRGGHHAAQVRVNEAGGVVDDVGARRDGRLGDGGLERVRGEDQPGHGLGALGGLPAQGRDERHHPPGLLAGVQGGAGRERDPAHVHPLRAGLGGRPAWSTAASRANAAPSS